jgi:hypothetical protein
MTLPVRRTALLAALLAATTALAPRGAAEDAAPANDAASLTKALVAEIDAAEKAKDATAIAAATKRAAPLYRSTQDPALRASIVKSLGSVLKNEKIDLVGRKAALTAILETEDSTNGWKALSAAYPPNDSEDASKFDEEIVKGVGLLHPDAAIERLLETFQKAKQGRLSAAAATALGNYKKSKKREHILLEMAKAGRNMVPSQSKTANVSKEAQARWQEVAPALALAFDTLTGEKLNDPIEWFKRIDEAKKNLKSLFRD